MRTPLHPAAFSRITTRIVAVVALTVCGAIFASHAYRSFETHASVLVLRLLQVDHLSIIDSVSVQVFPPGHSPFRAIVTPSCSALSSMLAIAALGSLTTSTRRRWLAMVVAVLTVAAGNIVRIVTSIGIGVVAGRNSLVLFHDWVGGVFTFVYTLGGFVLMVYLMLPRHRPPRITRITGAVA